MSANPYSRAHLLEAGFQAARPIPTIPIRVAREAYVADEIDMDEFEQALGSAMFGNPVEPSLALQSRAYEWMQHQVRFSPTNPAPFSRVRFV